MIRAMKRIISNIRYELVCLKQGLTFVSLIPGDMVVFLWPWKRDKITKKKWLSVGFECTFNNLEEIKRMWDSYFNYEKNQN